MTGSIPGIPRSVAKAAAQRAVALGRPVLGDELSLLALFELEPGQPARRALETEGITEARLLEEIRADGDRASGVRGATYSPASYCVKGRAEGFAATLGDGTITPEHLLLALIWDPTSTSSRLLWRLGVQREQVLERLQELAVAVPKAALPAQREIEWGEKVWFGRDEVTTVLSHIQQQLSPQTQWGFNYADDGAWAIAERRVDLPALVDEARARAARGDTGPQIGHP